MSVNFDSHGSSALGERVQSALDVFSKSSGKQVHIGTSANNGFGAFAQDSAGVYIATGTATVDITRLVEINPDMDAITRVRDFFSTAGGVGAKVLLSDANYIYAFGDAGDDSAASVWRFTKASLAERFKDFDNLNGIFGADALIHSTGLLLLCSDSTGTRIFLTDSNLALTGRHRYVPASDSLEARSIVHRPPTSSYVFAAMRTPTVIAYVEVSDASFSVIDAHDITLTGVSVAAVLKIAISGDILVTLLQVNFSSDRVIIAVNLSTHTFLWGKRIEGDFTPGFGVNSISADATSVYGVGDYKQSGFPTSMAIMQLALSDGSTQKISRMRSHIGGSGTLRQAMIAGSDLWFGGEQATEQQNEVTIASFDSATTYNATISGVTVSQIGTTNANTTATNLKNACDASTDPGFAALTWSVLANVIHCYGSTAFTLTTSVIGGTGLISSTQVTDDNTFGATDLQLFKAESITDAGLEITAVDVTASISPLTVTKSTPADTSGTAADSTGTAVTGYEIAPSTFTI